MTSIYWLIAFVVFVGIEVATMALTTIWFAGRRVHRVFALPDGGGRGDPACGVCDRVVSAFVPYQTVRIQIY